MPTWLQWKWLDVWLKQNCETWWKHWAFVSNPGWVGNGKNFTAWQCCILFGHLCYANIIPTTWHQGYTVPISYRLVARSPHPMQNIVRTLAKCYVKVVLKSVENVLTVTLVERYFHVLHFIVGSVNVSVITLLPEHPFNTIYVKKYCFIMKSIL